MRCELWVEEADLTECPGFAEADGLGLVGEFALAASEIMYLLSGSQFEGECTATLRPCITFGSPIRPLIDSGYPWTPLRIGGVWVNVSSSCSCSIGSACGCSLTQLDLLRGDVRLVDRVVVNGVELDPTAYRLDENRYLMRIDGGVWPCCQDLTKADTETGTWAVDVTYGDPVPASGKLAAKVLACQLIAASYDPSKCALPVNATNVVRQGISMELLSPELFLDSDLTGVREIDLFLRAVNPNGLRRRGRVWSPELKKHRQVRSNAGS